MSAALEQFKAEMDALVRIAEVSPYHDQSSINTAKAMRDAAVRSFEALAVETLQSEWLPIESAPKDGTYFLFAGSNFDGGMAVVHWDADLDWWTLDDGKNPEIALRGESNLTGWRPLPPLNPRGEAS